MADEIFERLKGALADRYRLDRLIGQGGMATVYLAEDLKHRRQVAIKALRPDLSAALGADRFLREIELAAKLQHPHIVPVYDSGSADGVLYYVMPYIEGESLRDLLRREKRLSVERAAEIVRGAATGLAYAHGHGIVHRDVKPENIMFSGDLAVVTDFGIARAVDASRNIEGNLTGVGMAMGTPAYMSPEQATADQVDGRTDQYALACVFYEMVSGQQAFSGPTMQAMLASILTSPRPRLASTIATIPPAIDAATQRALATDPTKRFDNIMAFVHAVAQESSGAAAATRESRRWKKIAFILPVSVAIAAGIFVTTSSKRSTVVSGAETIAVVPFSTNGAGLEGMSEGIVDLLSPSLDGMGAIRTIEPRSVLQEWHKRARDGDTGLDVALAVARSAKATSVLTGSIVASGGTARLTAELYDLDGKSLAQHQVSGPADSVLILADSLARGLVHAIWRSHDPIPSANSASITSLSIPAIKSYLRGEGFQRRGAWDSARVAFEDAVQQDSTFALAWYRLANTLGWMGQYQSSPMLLAAANAERYSDSLPKRLRALMVAYHLFAKGSVSATDSAMAYTRQFPNDADGWFLLGESQYHTVGYHPLSPQDLRAPFDKVLALDSSLTPAAIHPMELALQEGNIALLRRYEAVFREGGDSTDLKRLQLAREFLSGSEAGLTALANGGLGAGATRAALSHYLSRETMTGDSVVQLAHTLARSTATGGLGFQFKMVAGQLTVGVGHRDQAMKESAGINYQGQALTQILSSYPLTMGFADPAFLARADSSLQKQPKSAYVSFMLGLVALDRGDAARATAMAKSVLSGLDSTTAWLRGPTIVLDGLATVAAGDTLRGMARADSGMRMIGGAHSIPFSVSVQVRYAQLELARPATRSSGIARLRYSFPGDVDMIPLNALRIAKAYELAEIRDSSAANYRRFMALFNAADSNFAAIVADAKAGLARVSGEKPVTTSVDKKQ